MIAHAEPLPPETVRRAAELPGTARHRTPTLARPGVLVPAVVLAGLGLVALAPSLFAPNDPDRVVLTQQLQPASAAYPLGTDQFGRCIFSRLVYGARATLGAALLVLMATIGLSTLVGSGASLSSGAWRALCERLLEVGLALPTFVVAVAVVGLLGPGLVNGMVAVAATSWAGPARILRALLLVERRAAHVLAARAVGATPARLFLRHLVPGLLERAAVVFSLGLGQIILGLSALSYLGLGPQPPTAEWGAMLSEGRPYFFEAPALMVLPGAAIVAVVGACNLLSEVLGRQR